MANRRVLVNTLKHTWKRYNQHWPLAGAVPYLHNTHWRSEALIPNYRSKSQKAGSFSRAKSPTERSHLGEEFLNRNSNALVRAANSVVGTAFYHYSDWFEIGLRFPPIRRKGGFSTSTAFRVGEGGFAPKFLYDSLTQSVFNPQSSPRANCGRNRLWSIAS
jgi:hypothetical protein